ncbi:MAG: TlpA disulfide reductase family protein [Flavobacteriaceae bacterium]|nr:TlpA disulfide reductase family protein [Flavobacteriaceae bacterium]
MKKIIAVGLILALASCNKKQESTENTEIQNNKTPQLVEMNAEEVANFLAPKENDTIYVTNFFATWCGPCMHEIPYFKQKMDELKNEKVKFTFINLDNPKNWNSEVSRFAMESGLEKNIILFNFQNMTEDFFSQNFQTWTGEAIPFTLITKGKHRDETIGMMSKEDLTNKINALKSAN